MTWTKLSDTFTDRPEMLRVSRSARLLHVEALIWCNRMLTDGELPRAALPRLTDATDLETLTAELEAAGLWVALDMTRWQLDWTDQERADTVRERQQNRAEIQKRYRERRDKHERGNHSMCDPRYCTHVTSNATGNEARHKTPSRPFPSRPAPKGQGAGGAGRRCAHGHPVASDETTSCEVCTTSIPLSAVR